ncbi:hypothetical protein GKZ90_0007795 [Flavobacterium sp. MC2016-06]|jgi:hypothetical protein|uniref:hypothetical protein n=1 Tax=Flavobacterium sp. MC2016-06 TaxID=2676308 RepID=UPI0012BB050E|nr:hypothetical protein [Flavobacterium sp. MC2016-06]MBU3858068.1 hypothetical protein [Flavobacterium sp. MC2016-06]
MAESKSELRSNLGRIVVFSIVMTLLFFIIRHSNVEHEKFKKRLTEETIGFATRTEYANKTTHLKYYFYLNGKILSETKIDGSDETLINKFYKVKYNPNNPEENEIVLDEKLEPDSISLVKAGFTKTKYYIYDAGVTCKYIEHSKWK